MFKIPKRNAYIDTTMIFEKAFENISGVFFFFLIDNLVYDICKYSFCF